MTVIFYFRIGYRMGILRGYVQPGLWPRLSKFFLISRSTDLQYMKIIGCKSDFTENKLNKKKIFPQDLDPLCAAFFSNLAYFLLNRSTLPAESTSFCLPVKKGWHLEQISTFILLAVEPVLNSLPQAHLTIAL